jgi:sodium pump decarboxylase gamma subunit
MKKFLTLICLITCVFGLTACGSEDTLTELEQSKVTTAESYASETIVPVLQLFMNDDNASILDGYTADEVAYWVNSQFSVSTDGYAFINAVSSFNSAKDTMGQIVSIGEAEAEIDDDQIVVYVQVEGEKKDAEAEIIFSNDMFLVLESASLNPVSSMGELMGKAALNTLIGMGTVFIVLILISCIISLFKYIPMIQEFFTKKTKDTAGVDNAVAQITIQEEAAGGEDDLELVAVIAAAIAASEGASSADGFVVRSIRKVNRARR